MYHETPRDRWPAQPPNLSELEARATELRKRLRTPLESWQVRVALAVAVLSDPTHEIPAGRLRRLTDVIRRGAGR